MIVALNLNFFDFDFLETANWATVTTHAEMAVNCWMVVNTAIFEIGKPMTHGWIEVIELGL